MKIYLFDSIDSHQNLLPLSVTRPLAAFRCGILTIQEKWEKYLGQKCLFLPVEYLCEKYGEKPDEQEKALFIAGNLLPRPDLCEFISNSLHEGESVIKDNNVIVFKGSYGNFLKQDWVAVKNDFELHTLEYVFDVFLQNPEEIKLDFKLLTEGRKSQPLPPCVRTLDNDPQHSFNPLIFIEEGATVECATINVSEGPVYIGKDSILMEGSCVRGPFALCESSEVRMGAKIYQGTTIGPHCKVGGEIGNTVFFGYSNKAHDGYLGNAVIGEWCNIGAGTNASNLKNDYSLIRVWNYKSHTFMRTNLQFCGVIMGDHSKIGVNCMINTATVIGVGVNIHGSGFPRTFIPCFSEGSPGSGFSTVSLKKFLEVVERVMSRRNLTPSAAYLNLLSHIYDYKRHEYYSL